MIIISHKTAFRFWRTYRAPVQQLPRLRQRELPQKSGRTQQLPEEELTRLGIYYSEKLPLDLLFLSKDTRIQHGPVRAHVTEASLPAGSLLKLAPQIAIVSPELCFTQLAREISVPRLAMFGSELCGNYGLEGPDAQRIDRPAVTTAAALQKFAAQVQFPGAKAARQAARYVLDDAESPREVKLALLLTMATNRGGYGLPAPQLNAPIRLSPEALRLYPHSPCRLDLYWADASLDLEYDGEDAHTGDMHAKDVARAAALKLEGVEVVALTAQQLGDVRALDEVAALVANRLGKTLRIRVEGYEAKQAALREELGV